MQFVSYSLFTRIRLPREGAHVRLACVAYACMVNVLSLKPIHMLVVNLLRKLSAFAQR